jgi:hypothetical protein
MLPARGERSEINDLVSLIDVLADDDKNVMDRVEDELAAHAPRGAIIASWAAVEDAARRGANLLSTTKSRGFKDWIGVLLRSEVVNPRDLEGLKSLRTLRNEVAHEPDRKVTTEQADAFVERAEAYAQYIEARAGNARVIEIMRILNTDEPKSIVVGRQGSWGIGATEELARANARRRSGQWIAKTESASVAISEEDALLLIKNRARYEQKPLP